MAIFLSFSKSFCRASAFFPRASAQIHAFPLVSTCNREFPRDSVSFHALPRVSSRRRAFPQPLVRFHLRPHVFHASPGFSARPREFPRVCMVIHALRRVSSKIDRLAGFFMSIHCLHAFRAFPRKPRIPASFRATPSISTSLKLFFKFSHGSTIFSAPTAFRAISTPFHTSSLDFLRFHALQRSSARSTIFLTHPCD